MSKTQLNHELMDLLREGNFIDKQEASEIKKYLNKTGKRVSQAVVDLAIMPDHQVGILKADILRIPFIKLGNIHIDQETLDMVPAKIAKENKVMPFRLTENTLYLATDNVAQKEVFQFLKKKTKKQLKIYLAAVSDIKDALRAYEIPLEEKLRQAQITIDDKGEREAAESIAQLLDDIIHAAALEHASDIHIEPQANEIVVRIRLDGVLKDIMFLPKKFEEIITTRVKVLANLRTDEHRAAQDGRIKMEFEDLNVTLRVSIIPIYDGEKIVLRLLASQGFLNLENLGYSQRHLTLLRSGIQKPHGMILVTGPTGSGKTTTLYSILRILNNREVNISTIEDPIEIRLPGVNQIQVNKKSELNFSTGLRSILRQDPDIILVGEIRDTETADIAINAALTGHLVFATLHTNDAASCLPRLLEMGIEHFLVASTVNTVVAQRLVRKICPHCIQSKILELENVIKIFQDFEHFNQEVLTNYQSQAGTGKDLQVYEGKGCERCNKTGFHGRLALAEIIEVDDAMKLLIKNKALPGEIMEAAREKGMITMMEDGVMKVLQGLTTIEEVLRVTRE